MQGIRRLATAALAVIAMSGAQSRAQTPFDFMFQPTARSRAVRPHPRRAVDVPLPVPRPRFAGDPPIEPDAAPVPTAPPSSLAVAPPEPPPRPDTLAKPDAFAKSDSAPPPRALPPAAPPPPVPAAPKPPSAPVAASGATTSGAPPRQPADDPSCPGQLKSHAVAAEPISLGPQADARCTIVEPVRLTGLTLPGGDKIDFPDHPTIACVTADTFARYVAELLSPLAKGTYGAPVASVWTGPGFECRSRDHIFGAKLSAHGQGLAVDIAQLKLADSRTIAVGDPKTAADTAFETAARAGACGYFHTVLGPGSDSYHRTHWHFDLEVRGSGGDSKYCK